MNDLDLYVTTSSGRRVYFPNGLDGRDSTNNVERVRIDSPTPGDIITVHVEGKNLVSIQEYSLVVTGCFVESEMDAKEDDAKDMADPSVEEGEDDAGSNDVSPRIDCMDQPTDFVVRSGLQRGTFPIHVQATYLCVSDPCSPRLFMAVPQS